MDINNTKKNASSAIRGVFEVGSVVLKALPTEGEVTLETGSIVVRSGISFGLKAVSWALLPVTYATFGVFSRVKVNKDCKKILDVFDE